MKYILSLITVACLVVGGLGPALGATETAPADPPKAVFPQVKFEFDEVVDGTQVSCDFAVKNTGKGVLEISHVKTG